MQITGYVKIKRTFLGSNLNIKGNQNQQPVCYYFNMYFNSSQNIFHKICCFYHALHINVSLKFVS
jgi:hypothetical protein